MSSEAFALTPADRAAYLEFAARVPMSAEASVSVERHGAACFDHFGGHSLEFGVRVAGRPAAYAHAVVARHRFPLSTETIAYVGDIRVDPTVRRARVGTRLLDAMAGALAEQGVRSGFCFVNDGNEGIVRLFGSGRSRMRGAARGSFRTGSRLLVTRPRPTARFVRVDPEVLRSATRFADALASLPLAVCLSPTELYQIAIAGGPDFALFAEARAPERLAFAVWNQRRRRRLRLNAVPRSLGPVLWAWRHAARWTGGPPPPRVGEPWSAAELCWIRPDVRIADAVADASAAAWSLGSHLLNMPLEAATPRGLWHATTSHLVMLSFDGHLPPVCPGDRFAHDLSRV